MKIKYALLLVIVFLLVGWSSAFAAYNPCASSTVGQYVSSLCVDMTNGNVTAGYGYYPNTSPTVYTWQSVEGDATFANQLKADAQMGYAKICQQMLPFFSQVNSTPVALSNDLPVSNVCGAITTMQMQGNYVQYSIGAILSYQFTGAEQQLLKLVAQVPYPTAFVTVTPVATAQPSIVYLASVSPVAYPSASPVASATPTPPPSATPMTNTQMQNWTTYTFCQGIVGCIDKTVTKVCMANLSQPVSVASVVPLSQVPDTTTISQIGGYSWEYKTIQLWAEVAKKTMPPIVTVGWLKANVPAYIWKVIDLRANKTCLTALNETEAFIASKGDHNAANEWFAIRPLIESAPWY